MAKRTHHISLFQQCIEWTKMKKKRWQQQSGFTIVELLVVFTIMAILSTTGFASFVNYNRQQILDSTIQDIKTMLYSARSLTLAQVNQSTSCYNGQCNCSAGQTFDGYKVLFCSNSCSGLGCPTCISDSGKDHAELDVMCSGQTVGTLDSKKLPSQVTFSNSSTSRSFQFLPLTGLVMGEGTIAITGYSQTRSATVTNTGVISSASTIPTATPIVTPGPTATPTPSGGVTPTPTPVITANTYKLINTNSGKALDVAGAGTTDGTNVQIYTDNGTGAQKWQVSQNGDGTYKLTNTNSGKVLDVNGGGTSNNTNVQIWTDISTPAQKWQITQVATGVYKLINPNSGKALDVAGAGTANNTNVDIYTDNGTGAQKWQIIVTN